MNYSKNLQKMRKMIKDLKKSLKQSKGKKIRKNFQLKIDKKIKFYQKKANHQKF